MGARLAPLVACAAVSLSCAPAARGQTEIELWHGEAPGSENRSIGVSAGFGMTKRAMPSMAGRIVCMNGSWRASSRPVNVVR